MPQCTYRNPNDPYGKGSLNGELLEVTFRTRRRAARINEGENTRFSVYSRIMEKHQATEEERKTKVRLLLFRKGCLQSCLRLDKI